MKRIITILIIGLMLLSLTACDTNSQKQPDPQTATGETNMKSPLVTDEISAMIEKVNTQQMTGAALIPLVYLESHEDIGVNHLVFCKLTQTAPDTSATYVLAVVFEDPDGNVSLSEVQYSGVSAPEPYDPENPVSGGWGEPTSPVVTDEVKTALEKACEDLNGVTYEPKAYLAMQVVAGFNYRILCKVTPNVPDPVPHYAIVTVYADLDGGAEITHDFDFTAYQYS